tara:strand:+ start:11747 stop:13549 length:1803 start_codon:yes stop_codon:yes gene_type:complete
MSDQTSDERRRLQKNDFSHLMLTSTNDIHTQIEARDGNNRVLFWDEHPDFGGAKIEINDSASVTSTGPIEANMAQYPSNQAWQRTGGISLDGLFVPYSTNFKVVSTEGATSDLNKTPNVSMPSYERPFSEVADGVLEDSVNWAGVGVDGPGIGMGVNGPAPPFVTSVSLNPYASGHYVQFTNRNKNLTDANLDIGGYAKDAPTLTNAPETSTDTARPVGLRGPLVVAGWGYDTYERPVPNLRWDSDYREDDYSVATYGRTKHVPQNMQGRTASGTVRRDFKHFLPQHMRRQDKWKVGPVDLRWDNQRKVWVGGKHNGIFLSKAVKCVMPQAGMDGNNSFNFGVGGNVNAPGRLYRNPCPTHNCTANSYFPTSIYYPDIEIYDPEDHNWCGRCRTLGHLTACADFKDGCVPFYDAVILRPIDEVVGQRNVPPSVFECTDKFRKVQGGSPRARRAGNPCHGWGSSYFGETENINEKIGRDKTWTQQAKSLMYEKIFIENPLGQGLMVGDAFFSYDTGKRIMYEYQRTTTPSCGQGTGELITVKESIPVHIILQGEFYGMEIITHAGCDRGEMAACSKKFFAQGFATDEDCGPDDDYPQTAGM